jgi:hypothetical protein
MARGTGTNVVAEDDSDGIELRDAPDAANTPWDGRDLD